MVEYLKDAAIEIPVDAAGLKDAGVNPDQQVTKNISGMSLRSALKLLLDDLQLKYVIHNEVLLITSPTKAESDEFMETKAYPVTDLVVPDATARHVDMQPLMDLLENTVAAKSWDHNGGNGSMSDMIVGKALLVTSQTQEVHEQIADMLETLRKAEDSVHRGRKLAEQEQSEDETDLPARTRLHRPARGRWAKVLAAWEEWAAVWAVDLAARARRRSSFPLFPAATPTSSAGCEAPTRPISSRRPCTSSSARTPARTRAAAAWAAWAPGSSEPSGSRTSF